MTADLKELAKDILGKGYLMSLATVDDKGVWVADVTYAFDNQLNIYWISDVATRHSVAIVKNPHVAATITVSDRQGMSNMGLQIEGDAEIIEGDIMNMAFRLNIKKGKPAPDREGEVLTKKSGKYGGVHKWFRMKPKRIDVLYAVLFGFKKQVLVL